MLEICISLIQFSLSFIPSFLVVEKAAVHHSLEADAIPLLLHPMRPEMHKSWAVANALMLKGFHLQKLIWSPSASLSLRWVIYFAAGPHQARKLFLLGSESLCEEYVYVASSNKFLNPLDPLCWSWVWSLSLSHFHWICLAPQKIDWKPCRSGALETGLVSAGANSYRCFHYYVQGSG